MRDKRISDLRAVHSVQCSRLLTAIYIRHYQDTLFHIRTILHISLSEEQKNENALLPARAFLHIKPNQVISNLLRPSNK